MPTPANPKSLQDLLDAHTDAFGPIPSDADLQSSARRNGWFLALVSAAYQAGVQDATRPQGKVHAVHRAIEATRAHTAPQSTPLPPSAQVRRFDSLGREVA